MCAQLSPVGAETLTHGVAADPASEQPAMGDDLLGWHIAQLVLKSDLQVSALRVTGAVCCQS